MSQPIDSGVMKVVQKLHTFLDWLLLLCVFLILVIFFASIPIAWMEIRLSDEAVQYQMNSMYTLDAILFLAALVKIFLYGRYPEDEPS